MNYYIATKFSNTEAFHELRKLLESHGHTLTHDWTKEDAEKVPEAERASYLELCAAKDFNGVIYADMLILLATPDMGGALVEYGIALGSCVPVVIMGAGAEGVRKNIFYHLPQCGRVQHVNGTEALLKIMGSGKGATNYDSLGVEDSKGNVSPIEPAYPTFDPSNN